MAGRDIFKQCDAGSGFPGIERLQGADYIIVGLNVQCFFSCMNLLGHRFAQTERGNGADDRG